MSKESQTVIAQQAREIGELREAAGRDALTIVSHREEINELKEQVEDLKREAAHERREREIAQGHFARADEQRREAGIARREMEKALAETKVQLDTCERERRLLAETLRENREAWNEARAQLLKRQGQLLDQLDRLVARETARVVPT